MGKIRTSLGIISSLYASNPNNIGLCFNGGKDSTVLLDLVAKYAKEHSFMLKPFYLESKNDFPEIKSFISEAEKIWNLKIIHLPTENLKDGLVILTDQYKIDTIFLGVRNADLDKKLSPIEPTSPGWPRARRVMPLLDWTYKDVWEYIDTYSVPVCSLYSKGYTSIGNMSNTKPNPYLYDDKQGIYKHARELRSASLERINRLTQ